MNKHTLLPILAGALFACNSTIPEPYQADRAPEERTEYNGVKGVIQQQKDQSYLLSKELSEKCENAKIDLAVAKATQSKVEAKRQQRIIELSCR